MSERELLEAAARAAGYVLEEEPASIWIVGAHRDDRVLCNEQGGHSQWNPLTDDGDAFRLAVKLHLGVEIYGDTPNYPTGVTLVETPGYEADYTEHHNGDPLGATRRAIVRAAAALGAQSPEADAIRALKGTP